MLTTILMTLLLAGPGGAAPPVTAQQAFEDARRAYNVGQYREAINGFEKAYRLSGDPVLLYNLGQSHRQAGNIQEAITAYKSYLRERPEAPNRAAVETKLQELEASRHVVTAPPPRTETDVEDPFASLEARPSTSTAPAFVLKEPGRSVKKPKRNLLPWIGVGTTGALAAATIVSGILAQNHFDSLKDSCAKTGCSEGQIDGLKHRALVTNILLGLTGAAGVGTGAMFYFGKNW